MRKEEKNNVMHPEKPHVADICFGLNRATDEQSLRVFLAKCAEDSVLDVILPRLSDEELADIVSFLTGLLRRHLRKKEYHRLFLDEQSR